jgi:hypothetical protein
MLLHGLVVIRGTQDPVSNSNKALPLTTVVVEVRKKVPAL